MAPTTLEQLELDPELLNDPLKFVNLCWPDIRLYKQQIDMLYSVRDNVQTYVHAGNELGKDFMSGIVVVWWFASRRPARVITSSSGETQLENVLWSEIKNRLATSRVKFPWKVSHLDIRRILPDGTLDPMSYVIGHVTRSVENFQGHHLPNDPHRPRVLCLFDEASGIPDLFAEAAESWAHHTLVIGNPLNTNTFFYRGCKGGDLKRGDDGPGLLRKVIHIGAEHSPNVIYGKMLKEAGIPGPYEPIIRGPLSYEDFVNREILWEPIKRQIRLHGRFYEGEGALLFPPTWLDCSENAYKALQKQTGRKAKAMGVDGASGRDLTVYTVIDEYGILKQIAERTPNTMDIVKKTIGLMGEYGVPANRVCIDAGGGGKEISDRIRQIGHMVRPIAFGGAPTPDRPPGRFIEQKQDVKATSQVYLNRRVEMYDMASRIMNPETNAWVFGIPPEAHELREELAILPRQYNEEGKMWLPPKDKPPSQKTEDKVWLKKLLGRSPDRSDSLALAIFAMNSVPVQTVGAF